MCGIFQAILGEDLFGGFFTCVKSGMYRVGLLRISFLASYIGKSNHILYRW